jgi:hypothetical protein
MIKSLLLTALCAFLAAAGFFSLAAASGVAHGGGDFWKNFEHYDGDGRRLSGDGPTTTRSLTWTGGDTLEVAIGADVKYTQGPVASIVATGPKGAVDNLIVQNGEIRFVRPMRGAGDIEIVMTAPDVKHFKLMGSQNLSIDGYRQDTMQVELAGSGDVDINGGARTLKLSIAGSGDVDAADLTLVDADVNIAGSGNAKIGPTGNADISIAGSGDVELVSHPANVKSSVVGSGSITSH